MKRYFYLPLLLAASLLLVFSTQTLAERTLFDDFSSNYIDGNKWKQRTYVREIVDGQLVSKLGNRTLGMSAEIFPGFFVNSLTFANPDSINSIECEITIVEAKLDSATDSESFARIAGYFYNKNQTGGATGDIFSYIAIGDRGNGGLEAFWKVFEVLTDDTDTKKLIETRTIIGPGILQYNTPYKVKISYDETNNFSFIVNGQSDSYTGPTKERDPVTSWKAITSVIWAENGSNNGFVFAKFDNVYVNDHETVYDNFSSPLDHDKWRDLEYVRELSNGSLRANIQGINSNRWVSTYLSDSSAFYLEAKVRIESDSQLSSGAWGFARIQGYFYNESRGPGSGLSYNGYEDDVFVQVRLQYDSDGRLRARAFVDRSNNAYETDYTSLFGADFSTPIYFDTDYVLSIKYTGSQLIFQCNDETLSYTITTPKYIPFGEHRLLRTRVHLDQGESGYIKSYFDDVYVDNILIGDINGNGKIGLEEAIHALQITSGVRSE